MEFTDLLSELTKTTAASDIALISFGALCIAILLAVASESADFTLGTGICTAIALIAMVSMLIAVASSSKKTLDYELSRDKNYIYIDSHNNNLKSAKLKIIGEEKNTIYVLYEDKTYKIPVMIDKR